MTSIRLFSHTARSKYGTLPQSLTSLQAGVLWYISWRSKLSKKWLTSKKRKSGLPVSWSHLGITGRKTTTLIRRVSYHFALSYPVTVIFFVCSSKHDSYPREQQTCKSNWGNSLQIAQEQHVCYSWREGRKAPQRWKLILLEDWIAKLLHAKGRKRPHIPRKYDSFFEAKKVDCNSITQERARWAIPNPSQATATYVEGW